AEFVSGHEQSLIELALADFSRYRPHLRLATIQLKKGVELYPAPDDLISVRHCLYGQSQRRLLQPWQQGYPKQLPKVSRIDDQDGNRLIKLSHFPAYDVLSSCGYALTYSYHGQRTIKGDVIDIETQDIPLLLLRAIAEAVKYIAIHHLNKSVSVRNSIGGEAKNGTPAAIHQQLMEQFERQVQCA
ncbi:hypothetical protein, partial [Photobacterium sp. OFAV2-7]|uniref:hypothetical protein n=1 Tax=Photobacterium sp. OFAV2-7 TaxID=2917748 RepID=UPI001EF6EE6F